MLQVRRLDDKQEDKPKVEEVSALTKSLADMGGVALGPISLMWGDDLGGEKNNRLSTVQEQPSTSERPKSIARMTTEEWRAKYEKDGTVDLFVEEEFNAGSRLVVSSPLSCYPSANSLDGEHSGAFSAQGLVEEHGGRLRGPLLSVKDSAYEDGLAIHHVKRLESKHNFVQITPSSVTSTLAPGYFHSCRRVCHSVWDGKLLMPPKPTSF